MSIEVKIPYQAFPSELVPDVQKETMEYGRQVGNAISMEWFERRGGSCRFYDQWAEFHKRRLYARAEQPISKYKNEMSTDGDLSHLNLDFTPVPIIPKFVDIVVNGMRDREMSIKAFSQDIISAEKRNAFQDMIEADMIAKDFLMQTKEQFGIDAFNVEPDKLPEDDDELSLYMQLNYKPAIEIAEEVAIDTIMLENKYDEIRDRINYDMTVLGIGIGKHEFLKGDGVRLRYVDPANVVYSYTEDPYFDDCFYWGEVKMVHINELLKINPDLTDKELEEIRSMSAAWSENYPTMRRYDIFQKDIVTLLHFNYKTTKEFVYKKKKTSTGGEKVIKKDSSFNPEPNENFEKLGVKKDVWYEGIMIMGTQKMIKWEMSKNMVREKSSMQHAYPNYVACAPRMYKGVIESLVRRMIPFADQIQMTHLKLQQVKSRIVPDGVFIDADGINEVDLGTGAAYTPEDALRLYFQTGSVIGRSFTQDGEFNNARVPIQQLNTSSAFDKMQSLVSDYNHNLNMLRDVTGLNEARDASTPDPDALVGLQKLAALNSNVATRHILDASMYITKTLAECVSLRIADILQYSDMAEDFAMKIGKYNMKILEEIKELYLYNFGIFIEMSPDEEQKQMLEQNIQISLSTQSIELEDAIDIRMIRNVKLANEMLKVKRKKRQKERQEREDVQMQMQGQLNQESQAMAAEAKMQAIQAEAQAKMAVRQTESDLAIKQLQVEAALKSQLMDKEFQINMELKGMEADTILQKTDKAERAKDERVLKQASAQSKLIDQRKNNLPPMDFESSLDDLGDFDMESYEPK